MAQNLLRFVTVVMAVCGLGFLSIACDATYTSTVSPVATCVSTTPDTNFYAHPPRETSAKKICEDRFSDHQLAQKRALYYLGEYTDHYSDFIDIIVSDKYTVRITMTYISPELVEFVFLNHYLSPDNLSTNDYNVELVNRLNNIGNRNEIMFFVTITMSDYSERLPDSEALYLDIDVKQLTLTNAADIPVYHTHDDHVLDEPIPITRRPASGYVAYPISIMQSDNCSLVLDSKWDTGITLDIPKIDINGKDYGQKFWYIPFEPLISPIALPGLQHDSLITGIETNRLQPSANPPKVELNENISMPDSYWDIYWQDMGRYLWYRIMLENYP